MAVDHAVRARWASRVLRLRQGGLAFSLDDVQATAGAVEEPPSREVKDLEETLGVGDEDQHVIGAAGHPLSGLIRSFTDLDGEDNYVGKLFDMEVDELVEEWRKETGEAHKQMTSGAEVNAMPMTKAELDDCYKSQERDEALYEDQVDEMQETGFWPDPHRLGHGVAMQREVSG